MLRWQEGQSPPRRDGWDHAQTWDKGHGRIERRQLLSLAVRPAEVDWPAARQILLLRRQRQIGSRPATTEFHTAITSRSGAQADAAELLKRMRGHWGIENQLHWVRDATFGEDACRVRTGSAPQNLAALRNSALLLLHTAGCRRYAAALRRHAAHPGEALALIKASPHEN
jgi:hypothetical protein